jgi:hypothetical protein
MTEERLALAELLEKAGEGDFLGAVAERVHIETPPIAAVAEGDTPPDPRRPLQGWPTSTENVRCSQDRIGRDHARGSGECRPVDLPAPSLRLGRPNRRCRPPRGGLAWQRSSELPVPLATPLREEVGDPEACRYRPAGLRGNGSAQRLPLLGTISGSLVPEVPSL